MLLIKNRGRTVGETALKPIFQKRSKRMGVGREKMGEKQGKHRAGSLKPMVFLRRLQKTQQKA